MLNRGEAEGEDVYDISDDVIDISEEVGQGKGGKKKENKRSQNN